jgi:hypothetical protein
MELRLQLHHHLAHQKFVLVKEGDEWRQEFNGLEDAMTVAASMVSGTVPLFVLDEAGNVVSESNVHTAEFRRNDPSTPQ